MIRRLRELITLLICSRFGHRVVLVNRAPLCIKCNRRLTTPSPHATPSKSPGTPVPWAGRNLLRALLRAHSRQDLNS